jgi:retron-type reverse transcriptase
MSDKRQKMEEIRGRENCKQALARIKANKGSAGMDGMTVQQLPEHLKQYWPDIREQLLSGTYKPQPVKRVEIPKPDGGIRKPGIPTASANCTGAQIAFRMGGDPPSVSSTSRAALSGFEGTPDSRH